MLFPSIRWVTDRFLGTIKNKHHKFDVNAVRVKRKNSHDSFLVITADDVIGRIEVDNNDFKSQDFTNAMEI